MGQLHQRMGRKTRLVVHAKQLAVGADGMVDFADADELVGAVGACGVAGAELERRERHECLVAEGGGAEGCHAQLHTAAYKRMPGVDV